MDLPLEVWNEIFKCCDAESFRVVRECCRDFHQLCDRLEFLRDVHLFRKVLTRLCEPLYESLRCERLQQFQKDAYTLWERRNHNRENRWKLIDCLLQLLPHKMLILSVLKVCKFPKDTNLFVFLRFYILGYNINTFDQLSHTINQTEHYWLVWGKYSFLHNVRPSLPNWCLSDSPYVLNTSHKNDYTTIPSDEEPIPLTENQQSFLNSPETKLMISQQDLDRRYLDVHNVFDYGGKQFDYPEPPNVQHHHLIEKMIDTADSSLLYYLDINTLRILYRLNFGDYSPQEQYWILLYLEEIDETEQEFMTKESILINFIDTLLMSLPYKKSKFMDICIERLFHLYSLPLSEIQAVAKMLETVQYTVKNEGYWITLFTSQPENLMLVKNDLERDLYDFEFRCILVMEMIDASYSRPGLYTEISHFVFEGLSVNFNKKAKAPYYCVSRYIIPLVKAIKNSNVTTLKHLYTNFQHLMANVKMIKKKTLCSKPYKLLKHINDLQFVEKLNFISRFQNCRHFWDFVWRSELGQLIELEKNWPSVDKRYKLLWCISSLPVVQIVPFIQSM